MKENLSQQKLLEVLTHEIEVLRKTSKNIGEIAPIIASQLLELKSTKLKADIDINPFMQMLSRHEQSVKSRVSIPKWYIWINTIVIIILAIQSFWIYQYIFISTP